MITLVQRVRWARVSVDETVVGAIEHGALLLVGVEAGDTAADADTTESKYSPVWTGSAAQFRPAAAHTNVSDRFQSRIVERRFPVKSREKQV